MSGAAQVAAALGGKRVGREWRCLCPVHGGKSLFLANGQNGSLLLHCFGGCEWHQIFAALRSQGLVDGRFAEISPEKRAELLRREEIEGKAEIERLRRAICEARDLYRRGIALHGTPGEAYLRTRWIAGPMPSALRFVKFCPHRNGHHYSALVAPIVNAAGDQIAIHKTFLRPDGSGKADLPKDKQREVRGPMKGGAVRLACYRLDLELIVGEGIESTLSAMQLFGLPGWAALCAPGIEALELPPEIRRVVIAGDNDANHVGQRAALSAQERWANEGRSIRILLPPKTNTDFNDLLLSDEMW